MPNKRSKSKKPEAVPVPKKEMSNKDYYCEFEKLEIELIKLPPHQPDSGYIRPPITNQTFVSEKY